MSETQQPYRTSSEKRNIWMTLRPNPINKLTDNGRKIKTKMENLYESFTDWLAGCLADCVLLLDVFLLFFIPFNHAWFYGSLNQNF